LLLRPEVVAAQPTKIILFNGTQKNYGPETDVGIFGWAAQTSQGWIGRLIDLAITPARRDFTMFAGWVGPTATFVVPKGMRAINGGTSPDGVRAGSVCAADITDASITGSTVKLTGKLTEAENPVLFKEGNAISLEGNKDTGEMTYLIEGTLERGSRMHPAYPKGVIIVV
jgi:hypothetical protein